VRNPPVVLGLDFGGTKVAIAVCDLAGNRLAATAISTAAAAAGLGPGGGQGAHAIFNRSVGAARDLLAATAPGSELAAVGAATFGIPFEDRIDLAPAIEGWESLPFGRELRAAFAGAEVRMATDAKAGAAAELRWGALNGCDPGVYLNLGTGLAAAIIAGGRVVRGGNGAAGEIGYNLRAVSDVGVPLGQRMPLEGMVSGLGLARQAGGASSGSSAAPALTAADIFAAAPGNPELDDLLSAFAAELAFHLVNLAICVNPVRIAVGGGIVRSWDRIGPQLTEALSAGVPFPPELVVARFAYEAPLLGAVALAVEAAQGREQREHKDTTHQDTMIMDTMA